MISYSHHKCACNPPDEEHECTMCARPCFVRNAFTRADLNHRKFNRTTRIEASLPHSAHQRLQRNGERTVTDPKQGFTYRSGQTGVVRYRYIGPVWLETGRYRWNSNLNSNFAVQPVRTGIPAGLAGIPAGLIGNRSV